MTDIQRQGLENIQQLSGTFCFYSKNRADEYNHVMVTPQNETVIVNYHGPMLSDGTPGSLVNNEIHRPDDYKDFKLIGAEQSLRNAPKDFEGNYLNAFAQSGIKPVEFTSQTGEPLRHVRALIMPDGNLMQMRIR